jgi:hypothetical protein
VDPLRLPADPLWYVAVAAGFAYALVGTFLVGLLVRYANAKAADRRAPSHTRSMSIVESSAAFAAALTGFWSLAGAWVVLKVVGLARRRGQDEQAVFNIFLVGTGLNLAFGFAGGLAARAAYCSGGQALTFLPIACAPLVLYGLVAAVEWYENREGT